MVDDISEYFTLISLADQMEKEGAITRATQLREINKSMGAKVSSLADRVATLEEKAAQLRDFRRDYDALLDATHDYCMTRFARGGADSEVVKKYLDLTAFVLRLRNG